MNIIIAPEEIEELESLVEEYKELKADESYFYHLANYCIHLLEKKGVIRL